MLLWGAGDAFLAVTGSAKIKVYDRDCAERGESLQGDMYIRDQRNTKGHVSPCTYGAWHPSDKCAAPRAYPGRFKLSETCCAALTASICAVQRACIMSGLHMMTLTALNLGYCGIGTVSSC